MGQTSTTFKIIKASPEKIYQAIISPDAKEQWQAPDSMIGKVHDSDLREGGGYTMSLYYPADEQSNAGKTTPKEDRFTVKYIKLIPNQQIVEAVNFETDDPRFSGTMIMEVNLEPVQLGTKVSFSFTDIPMGISPEDNDVGTMSSLAKLAAYVE